MVSTEPELDAEGRPRHDDPRDNDQPIAPERKKHWAPWLVAALVLLVLAIVFLGP